jgi:tRNA U34 2-thiouridine synthase MnmA/TrmU
MKRKVKAISLFSGGLDSMLATRLIMNLGIEVIPVNFSIPFSSNNLNERALKMAEKLGVNLRVIETDEDYIRVIENPHHGYGRYINPCVDCRIYMLKRAHQLMNGESFDFVFTGEVLGERPMSQTRSKFKIMEIESELEGYLVRPLSAKLLPPTIPEMEGKVDRNKLLGIKGRSRKPQLELARTLGIEDFPWPAGGCLLTDEHFAAKLQDAFDHGEKSLDEINFLKIGRHFRSPNGFKIVIGRNEEENRVIERISGNGDALLEVAGVSGPLVRIKRKGEEIPPAEYKIAASLAFRYSDSDRSTGEVNVRIKGREGKEKIEAHLDLIDLARRV